MVRDLVELGEYQSVRRKASLPSAADQRLAEQLAGRETEARLTVRWLSSGEIDITSNSWVGVVHFSQLEVRVVPKFVGGALRVLRMLEYASGVDLLKRLPVDRPLPASGDDLFDLICLLLAEEARVLVRDGFLRGYRPVDEPLEVLRGRLRYRDQYLRRFGQVRPLECHFDEYDSNIPENQLVSAALTAARGRVTDPGVRSSIMRLVGLLADSCEVTTTDPSWFERVIRYDRRNERYRPAHELSLLVLRGSAFDDIYGTSSGRVGAFLLDMNVVFERFITRLVEDALVSTDFTVDRQPRLQAVIRDDTTGRSYAALRPDLVISDSTGASVPIDVKYKLYDTRKVSSSDVYQLFMYAYALGARDTVCRVGLMYPAAAPSAGPLLSVRPLGGPTAARITGTGLDIPAALIAIASKDVGSLHASIRAAVGDITSG